MGGSPLFSRIGASHYFSSRRRAVTAPTNMMDAEAPAVLCAHADIHTYFRAVN
jgi:hypothetical protein